MRNIQRFELIDRIGRELQARMTYTDIDTYLAGFDIGPPDGDGRSYNSKWVYAKERLAHAPQETIIRIADELELDHTFVLATGGVGEGRFWEPGHFRLFLSHLSKFRATAGHLQRNLRLYGISAFVAHVDIEPTKEWQSEIEAALFSMDALVAILMTGFKESNWTDQEVGVAIGRGVLIVPIIKGLDPYGFIGKYQGFNSRGKTISEVGRAVFDILAQSERTRARMLTALIDTTAATREAELALRKIEVLASLDDLPEAYLNRFRTAIAEGSAHPEGSEVWARANDLLIESGQDPLPSKGVGSDEWDFPDDEALPF